MAQREECTYDPSGLIGVPIGMFHCPLCGDMVVAGCKHPKHDDEVIDGVMRVQRW